MGVARAGRGRSGAARRWHRRDRFRRGAAGVGAARRVVGAGPGWLRRPAGVLTRGQGGGPGSGRAVATVGGIAVPVADVDAREAQLRAGALAAALPRAGTSEGRQLRRWLTPLLVTEQVV